MLRRLRLGARRMVLQAPRELRAAVCGNDADGRVVYHHVDESAARSARQALTRSGIRADIRRVIVPPPASGLPAIAVFEVVVERSREAVALRALAQAAPES